MAIDFSTAKTRQDMPTMQRLHELFAYPPGARHLTWKVNKGTRAKAGSIAGFLRDNGYRQIRVDGVDYPETWLIWKWVTGEYPPDQINHINTVRDDNHWENLELSTNPENHKNKTQPANNTSGVTGVYWHKSSGKWQAQVRIDGKYNFLGYYAEIQDAAEAVKQFRKAHGFSPTHGLPKDEIAAYHANQYDRPADPTGLV